MLHFIFQMLIISLWTTAFIIFGFQWTFADQTTSYSSLLSLGNFSSGHWIDFYGFKTPCLVVFALQLIHLFLYRLWIVKLIRNYFEWCMAHLFSRILYIFWGFLVLVVFRRKCFTNSLFDSELCGFDNFCLDFL